MSVNNYNNSQYEKKLSNIEKMKESLLNEKISINNEIKKRRKRYQSILISENKDLLDKLNNDKMKNKNGILKNIKNENVNVRKKRNIMKKKKN